MLNLRVKVALAGTGQPTWWWRRQQEAFSPCPWRTISRDRLQGHQSYKLVFPHCSPFIHLWGVKSPTEKVVPCGGRGGMMDNPPKASTVPPFWRMSKLVAPAPNNAFHFLLLRPYNCSCLNIYLLMYLKNGAPCSTKMLHETPD